jgi:GntR family transcriptional regulator
MAPRYRQLADALVSEIRSGVRPPGTRLPSIRDLTDQWGERAARQAVLWLKAEGWIVSDSTRGLWVAENPPAVRTLEDRVADLEAWRATVEALE